MTIKPFWEQVNEATLRQGNYLPGCLVPVPIFEPKNLDENIEIQGIHAVPVFDPTDLAKNSEIKDINVVINEFDLIVLTQSCDLENKKVRLVALCPIYPLSEFEKINPSFAKKCKWEEVRKGRVEGLHLLASPTNPGNNREALVVDFREIYSLPYDYLIKQATELGNRWRLKSPFLEHFSQGFAKLFMRVGLPAAIPDFK